MESAFDARALWKMRWIVLVAFVSTLVAAAAFTYGQAPVYRASASFVVSPNGDYEDMRSLVDVVDALSRRREIAGTYSQVATSRLIKQQATTGLGLAEANAEALAVSSRLVADTNVLEITVEGGDPDLVRRFADAVGARTAAYVGELYEAYELKPLDTAPLPASPVKPNKPLNLAVGALLGLGLGAGLAFTGYWLETALRSPVRDRVPVGALTTNPGTTAGTVKLPGELVPDQQGLVGHDRAPY